MSRKNYPARVTICNAEDTIAWPNRVETQQEFLCAGLAYSQECGAK